MSRSQFRILTGVIAAGMILFSGEFVAGEPIEDAIRGTARISAGPKSATGFVVDLGSDREEGKRFALVTAAHVLEEMESERCIVHFRLPDDEAGFVRRETELSIREEGRPLWVMHGRADVAAIGIELPSDVDVEPFDRSRIADQPFFDSKKISAGQEVYVPCFPAKVEANDAGFPILRRGSVASYPLTLPLVGDMFLVDYLQFGGDSGAPVAMTVENEPVVIGIAVASIRQTDTSATDFEERTMHTPLGLARVVRSALIRETLDEFERKQ